MWLHPPVGRSESIVSVAAALICLIASPVVGRTSQEASDSARVRSDTVHHDSACASAATADSTGGIVGAVSDRRTGRPLPGARIRLRLATSPSGQTEGGSREVRSGSLGRFHFCGLTAGSSVSLRVEGGDRRSVQVPAGTTSHVDLAADAGRPGQLVGRVRQTEAGAPIGGAEVSLPGLGLTTQTDDDGRFAFERLPSGTYRLQVEHLSFGPHSDSVTVQSARSMQLDIDLRTEPVDLPPLSVRVEEVRSRWLEVQGFYDRRRKSAGEYFTREDILDRNPARLSYMFRPISGIQVRDGHLEMVRSPIRSAGGARCRLQYIINGQAAALPLGVDSFTPEDVLAVEVYRGGAEVPTVFDEGRASCGAVVIWLRMER